MRNGMTWESSKLFCLWNKDGRDWLQKVKKSSLIHDRCSPGHTAMLLTTLDDLRTSFHNGEQSAANVIVLWPGGWRLRNGCENGFSSTAARGTKKIGENVVFVLFDHVNKWNLEELYHLIFLYDILLLSITDNQPISWNWQTFTLTKVPPRVPYMVRPDVISCFHMFNECIWGTNKYYINKQAILDFMVLNKNFLHHRMIE